MTQQQSAVRVVGTNWMRRVSLIAATTLFTVAAFAAKPVIKAEPMSAVKLKPSALAQMQAIRSIKETRTPAQNKISSRLYLALLHQKTDARLTTLTSFRFLQPDVDGRVAVDIMVSSAEGVKQVLTLLESLGDVVKTKSFAFQRVSARVHLADLDALSAMSAVRKVRERIPSMRQKINTSEGDATHGAAEARGFYGTSGAGTKVCVLSDGIDSLAAVQATGDLPAVVGVLPGQAGSGDEGTAMLEIVHDLAPGADLEFATADTDEATFATNITGLAADGCNIIVDDVIYLDESPFEDGPVAQAVNTVTSAGVLYFSSAGNEGNVDDGTSGTWEGDFLASAAADPAMLTGANLHDFGDGGNSILVPSGGGNPAILIWAEHYDLASGSASTDYDLYDMDGGLTQIFDASVEVQDGSGGDDFPIEYLGGGVFDGERLLIDKFASGTTSSQPMFNLIVFRGVLDPAVSTNGATRGHSAAAAAFSVAATPAASSFDGISSDGPYPGLFTSANQSEDFTSDGPRRIILDTTGAELTPGNRTSTGGVVRQKPDITAADGVSAAAPGFNPFYGTSAAAPHAAAIAALLKSAVPSLTPAQIRTALISTAIDIESAGTDRDTGAGIIMAHAALNAVGAVPQAVLAAETAVPTQVIGDGDAYVESNEIWNLIVPLTNNGGAAATGIQGVLTTSTPGVTINSGNSAYPDAAIGATVNNTTPFTFTAGPSLVCGSLIHFNLSVTYTGGPSPASFDFTIQSGQPGTPVTVSFTGPPVAIPDSAGADVGGVPAAATLAVSGIPGAIYDINVQFDGSSCSATAGSTTVGIEHSFVNDLQLTLIAPDATSALVVNRTDGGGNNFCQTSLDDESAGPSIQSVATASAPFSGSFTPNSPLSAFKGVVANGNWQLQAQDFFVGDTGNIRAFSLIITPAVCDAPALVADVHGTKTVSGSFHTGGTVTYTVTLTNSGGLAAGDNAGHEFTDILPSSLTLVSATATSGTAVASTGSNTVTWDGALPAVNGSVTITITATVGTKVPGGTTVSNQGTYSFDSNGDGTNDTTGVTDDPSVGGGMDATAFVVNGPFLTATKTVTGNYHPSGTLTYTVVITNGGNATQPDNVGNEFTDVLPAQLTLVSATATSGTAVATVGTNTVTWNGSLAASASTTITITATVKVGTPTNTTISNQGTLAFDPDGDGTNDAAGVTDDPGTPATGDATTFVSLAPVNVSDIPTLSTLGLLFMALGLAFVAMRSRFS